MFQQKKTSPPSSCWPPDEKTGGRQEKRGGLQTGISGKFLNFGQPQKDHKDETQNVAFQNNRKTEHCMVCGETLLYHKNAVDVLCSYCKRAEQGHITCRNEHYICEQCHNHDAMQVIEDIIFTTDSVNPYEIAELAMSFTGLPMLGCQHAYVAGGALMAALKNEGSANITNNDIKEVFKRTRKQAHGGYCGLSGVCGIAPAIGACFSVLTGAQCGADNEQRVTMEAVSQVTRSIADLTGPSCCKAYVRGSLKVAVEFLKENLALSLPPATESPCQYSSKHPHGCRQKKCPYF